MFLWLQGSEGLKNHERFRCRESARPCCTCWPSSGLCGDRSKRRAAYGIGLGVTLHPWIGHAHSFAWMELNMSFYTIFTDTLTRKTETAAL